MLAVPFSLSLVIASNFMFPAGLIQCAPTLKMLKVKPATCINLSGVENMAMAAMSQNHGTLFMHPN